MAAFARPVIGSVIMPNSSLRLIRFAASFISLCLELNDTASVTQFITITQPLLIIEIYLLARPVMKYYLCVGLTGSRLWLGPIKQEFLLQNPGDHE